MKSITEIKEQLTKITKWPWLSDNDFIYINKSDAGLIRLIVAETQERKDAAFIASAPETIDRLCRALEKAISQRNDALHDLYSDSEPDIKNNMNKALDKILSGKEQE